MPPRLSGAEQGTKVRIGITLSPACLAMLDEIAEWRGGSYRSHLIEEAVRVWYEARRRDVSRRTTGKQPHVRRVRPGRSDGEK